MNRKSLDYNYTGWLKGNAANCPTLRSAVFVTADDFMSLALKAYYAVTRRMVPPSGETWLSADEGMEQAVCWSGPEDLFDGLIGELGERLRVHARKTGHYSDAQGEEAAQRPSMAHGCAALSPAVGPAPVSDQAFT